MKGRSGHWGDGRGASRAETPLEAQALSSPSPIPPRLPLHCLPPAHKGSLAQCLQLWRDRASPPLLLSPPFPTGTHTHMHGCTQCILTPCICTHTTHMHATYTRYPEHTHTHAHIHYVHTHIPHAHTMYTMQKRAHTSHTHHPCTHTSYTCKNTHTWHTTHACHARTHLHDPHA